ncbi:MAG TPA: ABC transporter permease [Thermoanaerobaculia bacterium]|nr:ABC transporter permease [Thermoanaerobaculia bacterium]
MGPMIDDLRYALRSLHRAPAFSLAVVLTLGLGIGLNAAVVSAVHGVLLRPLGSPRAEQLYTVWQNMESRGGGRQEGTGFAVFSDWRARNRSFTHLAAFGRIPVDLGSIDPPESVIGAWVSHEYFSVLGIRPALGRDFLKEEETKGKGSVAILSAELWARRFGSDPSILGKSITANYAPLTVVGVLPPGFRAPLIPNVELWTPMPLDPVPDDRPYSTISVIGRLEPGVSPAAARADMDRVAVSLAADYPGPLRGVGATLVPALEAVAGPARKPLLLLLGATTLVLLIACVNVGTLSLSRATARGSELALRFALGARPSRIARLFVAECVLLGLGSAGLGLVLGSLLLALLRGLAPPQTPRLDSIHVDGVVVVTSLAVSLAAGLFAGLLPALWSWRRPFAALREAAGATLGHSTSRLRGVLIVAQLAATIVLLIGAGVLLRTLGALARVDPGFRTEKLVVGRLTVRPAHPPEMTDVVGFMTALEEGLRHRPEIAAVGLIVPQPLADRDLEMGLTLEGQSPAVEERQAALWRFVSPGYFQALGIPLVEGRPFNASDTVSAPLVAMVNQRFVHRFLAGRNALGRRLRSIAHDGPEAPWRLIVGVVRDVRGQALDKAPSPEVYIPLRQDPSPIATVVARASGSTSGALAALRDMAKRLRPGQVVARPETLAEAVDRNLAPRRFAAGLLGTFAAVALLLAAVGLYGVTALAVSQRQREFAVRLALGARPAAITNLVLRWTGTLVAAGALIGLAAAFAARRAVAGLLYGVRPTDEATIAAAVLVLGLVALAASLAPALRAGRLDLSPILKRGE